MVSFYPAMNVSPGKCLS